MAKLYERLPLQVLHWRIRATTGVVYRSQTRLYVSILSFHVAKSGSTPCAVVIPLKGRDRLSVEYHRSSA